MSQEEIDQDVADESFNFAPKFSPKTVNFKFRIFGRIFPTG